MRTLATLLVIAAAACSDQRDTDQLGIAQAPIQCAADSIPVEVGGTDGMPQFNILGPAAVVTDTLLVVNDRMSREFHLLGMSGGLKGTFGGQGSGPGEFDNVEAIRVHGDSIGIYDTGHRRLTWHDRRGNLLSTQTVPEIWPARGWIGPFDQRYLARAMPISRSSQLDQVVRDTVALTIYDAISRDSTVLDTIPGTDRFASTRGGFSVFIVPFGRRLSYAAATDRIVLSDGSSEFRSWQIPDGSGAAFTLPDRSRPITAELRETVTEAMSSGRAQEARRLLIEQLPQVDRTPSYGPIMADELGHVWIPVYAAPGEPHTEYLVVDSEGRLIEHTTWDRALEVIAASRRLVAAVTVDEFDVPVILLFPRTCTP